MKRHLKKLLRYFRVFIASFKTKRIVPIPVLTEKDMLLKDKVALITGGSSGIGQSIADEFLKAGAKVIIAGTNPNKLEKCIEKMNCENLRTHIINVRDVSSLEDKVNEAAALFPENRIDILVNSAGVISPNDFLDITEEDYDNTLDTNTKGTYFMCQAVAKHMIKNKIRGHILNVSSSSALRPAYTPYQISKWAIKGMTVGLANTLLPYGIVVNAIGPGPTATSMLDYVEGDSIYHPTCPAERFATTGEIAALAVHMVSGLGDMIVGDTFYITGGSGTVHSHR